MTAPTGGAIRVVQVGVYLDPGRRPPAELLHAWRDYGRAAAAAARAGILMTVVQAAWNDAHIVVDGVECHFVHDERPRGFPRLLARIAEQNPQVLHFEGLLFPRALRRLARRFPGVPILAQDHGSRPPAGLRRLVYRWGFAPLAGVIFTAPEQAEPFRAAGVLRAGLPVFQAVEGSTPFMPGDQGRARAGTGLGGDPCLLWVGNLDPNKDPLTVLQALAQAAGQLPGARLWMCYRHGALLPEVQARIAADPRLTDRVRLVGPVPYPDIERHFQAADFLVQASHKEGSGYGVIEALACGTTPLVTAIPSFRVITGEGAFGALFPPGDAGALARALCDWAARDRPGLRRRAREHFERALSFDAIGLQLAAAYRQACASR